MDNDKFLLCDGRYVNDGNFPFTPTGPNTFGDIIMRSHVQAHHETCNGQFKQWGVLKQQFWHNLSKHSSCFHAIANIVQLSIKNGILLFAGNYAYI